jgi:MarR family transcriptional regulator, transcriptional regulator for hemolysin
MSRESSEPDSLLALFDLIGELARRRYQAAERHFSALGLNHTEARLLTLLCQAEGRAAQDALSNGLSVDRTNAGRALQRLERDGYILRRTAGADRRAKLVEITPKGRAAVLRISRLRKEIARSFFGGLEQDEATVIVNLLGKALADEES